MGKSKKARQEDLQQYLQAFAGLTIDQLKSQVTDEPEGKFKFSGNEKVLALLHAVKYVYTDKVPPALDVFLDLVTNHIPVPTQYGLDAAEACMEGVRRLITHVIEAATKQRLIHSADSGNGVWVVHVSNFLIDWNGDGGWKAIKTPSLFPNGLVETHNNFAAFQKVLPSITSDESWATLRRNAMHELASRASRAGPLTSSTANMASPQRAAQSTALTVANQPATSSAYQPSSFTDESARSERTRWLHTRHSFATWLGTRGSLELLELSRRSTYSDRSIGTEKVSQSCLAMIMSIGRERRQHSVEKLGTGKLVKCVFA